ncbi:hypothetical protein PMY73_07030 [Clostridium tertium]|jgi:hypothetical protein|uniref:hypothetical protein n=1 Tax=Clostridium tertium TaxID=1559 RepID=UPI00163D9547|nr:hypothetical protein [Clostridium tertium]MDB1943744.1 hypothetical protein [Clostridium tertium]MDB1951090.1 hypothetical protein [Clostridium tertium]
MTTELFLFLCKKVDLSKEDMEDMTIGMCIDYMEEVIEMNNGEKKQKTRKATQADFDSF